jgi:16S rRNA G966 N2-methylase RsmD
MMKINLNKFLNIKINIHKDLRPTKNFLRKSYISLINNYKSVPYLLDFFCGSCVINFELAYIKLCKIYAIEKNKQIYENILFNIINFKVKNNIFITVINNDSHDWIKLIIFLNFSFILFDPPYNFNKKNILFLNLKKIKFLRNILVFLLETNKKDNFNYKSFFILKKIKIGYVYFFLLKKI